MNRYSTGRWVFNACVFLVLGIAWYLACVVPAAILMNRSIGPAFDSSNVEGSMTAIKESQRAIGQAMPWVSMLHIASMVGLLAFGGGFLICCIFGAARYRYDLDEAARARDGAPPLMGRGPLPPMGGVVRY